MKISDLFILHQGNGFELCNMDLSDDSDINFVSRTAQNNGVVAQVCKDRIKAPFPAGFITVALGERIIIICSNQAILYGVSYYGVRAEKRNVI